MKYLVKIESFDEIIEEEVCVNINGHLLRCFMSYIDDINIEIGCKYYANIDYEIYNDLSTEEVKGEFKEIQCIDESFGYNIIGKLNVDECRLESIINISIDEEDLYELGCYDNKYIKFKVDRFNIDFII